MLSAEFLGGESDGLVLVGGEFSEEQRKLKQLGIRQKVEELIRSVGGKFRQRLRRVNARRFTSLRVPKYGGQRPDQMVPSGPQAFSPSHKGRRLQRHQMIGDSRVNRGPPLVVRCKSCQGTCRLKPPLCLLIRIECHIPQRLRHLRLEGKESLQEHRKLAR